MTYKRTTVQGIEHHTDRLMFLTLAKPEGFTFKSGQFVRVALPVTDAPQNEEDWLGRAYSLASTPDEDVLCFYIAKVADGALSPRLFELQVGDEVFVDENAYGFLQTDRLEPHGTLLCLASGTGLASFLSIVKNNPWSRFDNVMVVHCVRSADEVSLRDRFEKAAKDQGHEVNFRFIAATTRESDTARAGEITCRLPQAIEEGFFEKIGFDLTPERVRVMVCGNPPFVKALTDLFKARGFKSPRGATLGTFINENF